MRQLTGPQTPWMLRALQLTFRPLEYMETHAQRYGDSFRVGRQDSPGGVYFSHPQALQEIFTADPGEMFMDGGGGGVLLDLLGENSLLLLGGERHQRQRRLLTPPFHGDRMKAYSQLICEVTQQVTENWKIGESFPIRSSMQEITLRVILQAVFGLHKGQRFDQLRQLLSLLLESMSSPLSSSLVFFEFLRRDWGPLSPWRRFLNLKQQVDQLLYEEIRERRERGNFSGSDILTLLLSARDEAGEPMTEEELHDELMTLLVAGHETTASALTWALYWIHRLPDVQEKLRHELDTLGHNADPLEISRLPYLTAVCQETLRIYPIAVNVLRVLKSPMQIMEYQLEPGTLLIACIYLTHHREDLYPEPKRFKPERFLERQFSQYEYLPFGGGHRRCIGAAFAQFEMKLVLATILSHFQLALTDSRPVKPVRRGLTMAPPSNLRMVATGSRC
ncbi:MAG TPA: cytochrome P450 [Coleofasciculaceae cyanobacterium]